MFYAPRARPRLTIMTEPSTLAIGTAKATVDPTVDARTGEPRRPVVVLAWGEGDSEQYSGKK